MHIKKLILLTFSILLLSACNQAQIDPPSMDLDAGPVETLPVYDGDPVEEDAFCIEIYQPVCGKVAGTDEWKTFSNDCFANLEEATDTYEGECRGQDLPVTPKICTMEWRPVCGKIQVQCITTPCDPVSETFGNRCQADAANAFDIVDGECS